MVSLKVAGMEFAEFEYYHSYGKLSGSAETLSLR